MERQEPTIKAADDATRLFNFYQSGAKNGDSAILIVGANPKRDVIYAEKVHALALPVR